VSSSLRRGTLAAAVIAFSIASLAACGAGSDAQTLEVKPDNAATSVGDIKVQNALVITQPDVKATGPAVISATLFNNGTTAQTLDSINVEGEGTAKITPVGGKGTLTVPAGGSIVLGGKGNASAALSSPSQTVLNGSVQKVTFAFSKTGDVSLSAFVVPAESYFSKWGPSDIPAAPTASATPATPAASPSGSATGSPSASTSSSATANATPSASASQ
jgi:copper(I)-binding protein